MPESSSLARARAQVNGVAGSRVVPTTRIGGAPAACSGRGTRPVLTGQDEHPDNVYAKLAPKVGEAYSNRGMYRGTCELGIESGWSRQLTATCASSEFDR